MADSDQMQEQKQYVPTKKVPGEFPLIDNDPHFRRVMRFTRPEDRAKAVGLFALGPIGFWWMERMSPSYAGKGAFSSVMKTTVVISMFGGFLWLYTRTIMRLYGATENSREVQMDMREMVDKVKKGEPLYGTSSLSPYMQGVSARNSRYSGLIMHIMPWFNFVNHNHHGVDTAKYYQQAERELAAEDAAKASTEKKGE